MNQQPMLSRPKRFFTWPKVFLAVASGLLIGYELFLLLSKLTPINNWMHGPIVLAKILCVFLWIIALILRFFKRKWLRITSSVAVSGLAAVLLFYVGLLAVLFQSIGPQRIASFISPDGKNTVLIFQSQGLGFSTRYTAKPQKSRYFYEKQNNGEVTFHDTTVPSADHFQITWQSDTYAVVHVDWQGTPQGATNDDNLIIVTFD